MNANISKYLVAPCALTLLLSTTVFPQGEVAPVVAIDSGRLVGTHFGPAHNEVMFLGIPYAAPPTGDRRWRPPAPVEHWKNDYRADAFAPSCPQPADAVRASTQRLDELSQTIPYLKNFRTAEDCLYLNVWTTNLGNNMPVPVMVWLHGGGGFSGNSWDPPFGPTFARKGVVVVSVEFRIGALGHMAHPALTAESPQHSSGNYGTLDEIAALQWIKRNIGAFGGDSQNVTIWGYSDGATKVCVLMASLLARGLFHRAILGSGQCTSYLSPELKRAFPHEGTEGSSTAEDGGIQLAKELKIPDGAGSLNELRKKSVDEILQKTQSDVYNNPTVDGWVLPGQPADIFRDGKQAHVPVIIGSTDNEEGASYAQSRDPSTVTGYKKWLEQVHFAGRAEEIFRLYPAATDAEVPAMYLKLQADDTAQAAYYLARDVRRAGQKAYWYVFDYPGKGKTAGLGAVHGADVKYLSGVFLKSYSGEMDENDKKLSAVLIDYWTHFAAYGDPNGPGLPTWSAFELHDDSYFEIGLSIGPRKSESIEQYKVMNESLAIRLAQLKSKEK